MFPAVERKLEIYMIESFDASEVSVKKYCEGDPSFQAGECCGREL